MFVLFINYYWLPVSNHAIDYMNVQQIFYRIQNVSQSQCSYLNDDTVRQGGR